MNSSSEWMKHELGQLIGQSEYGHLARIVADRIAEREPRPGEHRPEDQQRGGGLSVDDLEEIIHTHSGSMVNHYPGKPNSGCYDVALFFALHGKSAYGPGHYTFEEILQIFVQHTQGSCPKWTRTAVIITDSWWAPNYERWQKTIKQILCEQGIHLEVYLVGAGWAAPVPGF